MTNTLAPILALAVVACGPKKPVEEAAAPVETPVAEEAAPAAEGVSARGARTLLISSQLVAN